MLPLIPIPFVGSVSSHELFVALAVLASAGSGLWWTVRGEGLPAGRTVLALLLLAVTVFAGGRLHFALTKWHLFEAAPWRILRLSSGGLHAPGAILGAAAGACVIPRLLGLPLGRFVDGFSPAVGIGIALARLGCFLNGCCYGKRCAFPWAVTLGPESYPYRAQVESGLLEQGASHSLPLHPLPLYFALVGLAITGVLLWWRPHKSYDGQLGLILVFLFSASSALLEPLRAEQAGRVYWGSEPQLFWVGLAMTLVSFLALLFGASGGFGKRRAEVRAE